MFRSRSCSLWRTALACASLLLLSSFPASAVVTGSADVLAHAKSSTATVQPAAADFSVSLGLGTDSYTMSAIVLRSSGQEPMLGVDYTTTYTTGHSAGANASGSLGGMIDVQGAGLS